MKIRPSLILAAIAALAPLASGAEWRLVDDFEDGDLGDWALHAGDSEHVSLQIVSPSAQWPEQPINGLFIENTQAEPAPLDAIAGKALPISMEPGEQATLFWRVWMNGANNTNWYVMLSDLAAPAAFDEQIAVVRWVTGSGELGVLQASDGNSYRDFGADGVRFLPHSERWHNFWLVLNADTSAGASWSLYWQVSSDILPQGPLALLDDPDVTAFAFGREPESAIQTISIGTVRDTSSDTSSEDYWIIDDIYISEGINLSGPVDWPPPFTCDDYVDTGSFLGWIYLRCDGWAYSETLGWLFIPEERITADGGWVYVPR